MITLQTIQETLDKQVSPTDREGLENKLVSCIELLGASAKLKSEAYKSLCEAKQKVMRGNPHLKTNELKLRIEAFTSEEQGEYMLAERLNVSLSKAIDGLKAVLNITSKDDLVKWD